MPAADSGAERDVDSGREVLGTSGGVEFTPELLSQLAAQAEAGYDIRRLRSRTPRTEAHGLCGPMNDELAGLVLRAIVDTIAPSLLILDGLRSWLSVHIASRGLPLVATPLQEWSSIVGELFATPIRHASFRLNPAPVKPEDVSIVLAAASPQECRAASRTLVAASTFLGATALELSDEIDEAPASWPRPTDWEEGLRAVVDTAQRFRAAFQPRRLEEVLVDLLCT